MNKAIEVMKELDIPYRSIDPISHKHTISSDVFRVVIAEGISYILKLPFDSDRWRRETYYLNLVHPHIPVPALLHAIPPREDFAGAVLMQELSGHLLSHLPLTDKLIYQMGEILAKLHSIPVEKYGDLSNPEDVSAVMEEVRAYYDRSFEECSQILKPEFLKQCAHFVEERFSVFEDVDGPCIAHRDFRPGNVIGTEESINGVIDFEHARGSFAEEDFFFLNQLASPDPFLKGYASIRNLPHNLDQKLPLIQFLRALGGVGFTAKRNTWQTKHNYIYLDCMKKLNSFLN